MHSYFSIAVSYLDTLDAQRVDVEHVKMEPQDGVWWMYPKERRTSWNYQRPVLRSEGPKTLIALTLT